jgi:serine/threonine-protein kinase RsbW
MQDNLIEYKEWTMKSILGQEINVIEQMLSSIELKESRLDGIRIAVSEACVNAIEHGNQLNPNKDVKIIVESLQSEYIIRIYDEGKGMQEYPNVLPLLENKLLEDIPRGWGLSLISTFTDHVSCNFDNNGTFYLEMHFLKEEQSE